MVAYLPDEPAAAVGDFVVGFVFVVGGAVVLRRSAATGALLAATGLAWFLGGFLSWLVFLHRGPLVHLLLSFPRARLESRFERAVVAVAYVEAFVYPLGRSSVATLVLLAAVLVAALLRYARAGGEERRARGRPARDGRDRCRARSSSRGSPVRHGSGRDLAVGI